MTSSAALPFAGRTVISLDPAHYAVITRTVGAAFRLAHGGRWQALVAGPDFGSFRSFRFSDPRGRI